jgi:flagellar biosynthesis/type III secretory pathway chaperone
MNSLVHVLREFLANLEEEEHSLLIQDPSLFKLIMGNRSILLKKMHENRSVMVHEIDFLRTLHPDAPALEDDQDRLIYLSLLAGEDNVELLTLRDQILALTEKIEKQNKKNNFLLDNTLATDEEKYSHEFKAIHKHIPVKTAIPPLKKSALQTLELN